MIIKLIKIEVVWFGSRFLFIGIVKSTNRTDDYKYLFNLLFSLLLNLNIVSIPKIYPTLSFLSVLLLHSSTYITPLLNIHLDTIIHSFASYVNTWTKVWIELNRVTLGSQYMDFLLHDTMTFGFIMINILNLLDQIYTVA